VSPPPRLVHKAGMRAYVIATPPTALACDPPVVSSAKGDKCALLPRRWCRIAVLEILYELCFAPVRTNLCITGRPIAIAL
jgi:hypothetical protein